MKKLMMFAAAMTIVGGAYAAPTNGDGSDGCSLSLDCEGALVYNVKMNLRTVSGKAGKTSHAISACEIGTDVTCIRYPNFPYQVLGYLVACDCACDAIADAEAVLWSPRLKSTLLGEFDWELLHVLGTKKQAEAFWTFEGTDNYLGPMELVGAGFGSYSASFSKFFGRPYLGFSGYVVGQLAEPVCLGVAAVEDGCEPAFYWFCEDMVLDNTEPSIIYGSWAMKLNTAASKKYWNGVVDIPTPSYYGGF
ncbi:MAG: hypothetical protein FWG50_08800 [Kiritimatiellaeota bacterium]|nr:hypothetical protein [Kiritimatiellota bacterium]